MYYFNGLVKLNSFRPKARGEMNFLYLLLGRSHPRLTDAKAAIDLVRESFGKTDCAFAPAGLPGIVIRTERPISNEEMEVLGLITFV